MARVLPYNSTEPQNDSSLLSFPEKLWWIVNHPKCGEIHWNEQGTTIVIPSTRKFVDEVLNSPSSALFKTKNFSSFVRQLNLYGFRKVTEYPRRAASALSLSSKCEFKHTHFRKGRRDLLIHVKRHLYTPKKTEAKQQRKDTLPAKEKQIDQISSSTSINAPWNPSMYTPFFPWQASLQMPFTVFAPFCNAYQLTQMQQGLMTGVPNVQGFGLPGQFQQGLVNPAVMGNQSFGSCEGSVKAAASSASTSPRFGDTGLVSSHGDPVEAVESPKSLQSPPITKSTTGAPSLANAVIMSNTSLTAADMMTNSTTSPHNGYLMEYANVAFNSKLNVPTQNNASGSLQVTSHTLSDDSADSLRSSAQSLMMRQIKDGGRIDSQENYTEELFNHKVPAPSGV